MSASIRPADWLRFIDREYLSSYIREGGSAIKFAVAADGGPELLDGIESIATRAGYLVARVDAATTKVQMMDEIFFRVAEQIPWREFGLRILSSLAAEVGYKWPQDGAAPLHVRLAAANGMDSQALLIDLKKAITDRLFRYPSLPRDFRVAMTQLCIAELSGGPDGEAAIATLTDWLTGRNKAVSAVKPFHIFRRIHRTNARHFFESMLHWVRMAGYPGMAVLLDARRLTEPRNAEMEGHFYSKAAVMDTYEVLREFIDSSDRLEGCFLAIVSNTHFLEDMNRGIGTYEALKNRVYDEVRDRNLVNPMASLARIEAAHGRSL
ncbi:MAG: DUF2791 family P-loop domain-containing protein [Acidobacteria bacterium]|nr:DUF2791 family P-loop domain-containing protein [Acidobacteriota bacterium]